MALSSQLKDAAKLLAEGINSTGGAARTSLGGSGTAFGWNGGMVRTIADYATAATADGMTYKTTIVADTVTPAAIVAKNASKPAATQITAATQSLKKFAGIGSFALEDHLDATGLGAAIASVIGAQCLKAYELDAVAALSAGSGQTVTGTEWVAAVANAQAVILGNGGAPSVLVLSKSNYGDFVADVMGTNAFSQSPESPIGTLLGTPIHVSPSAPAGFAYVFNASAVLAVQHAQSPLVIVDALSGAATNTARIVVDLVAGTFVADTKGVVKITAPAAARSTAAAKK